MLRKDQIKPILGRGNIARNLLNTADFSMLGTFVIFRSGTMEECERFIPIKYYTNPLIFLKRDGDKLIDQNKSIITKNISNLNLLDWENFEIVPRPVETCPGFFVYVFERVDYGTGERMVLI